MNAQVKSAVNKVVAELCAWSLQFATSGVGPLVGFEGEPFKKIPGATNWLGSQFVMDTGRNIYQLFKVQGFAFGNGSQTFDFILG